MGKALIAIGALTTAITFTGCSTTEPTMPTRIETTPSSDSASTPPLSPSPGSPTPPTGGWGPTTSAPSSVEPKAGPLEGTRSPILEIELPSGSEGTWNVNDFNDDGKPNHFEDWTVPLGYDETVAYLTEKLNPHYTRPNGMPWLEGDEPEGELGERYVDWWWGVSEPELLVRPQEFGEVNETTVFVESREP